MSRTTITLPGDLVDELMLEVNAKNKTAAVTKAVWDEIRLRKKEIINSMVNKMKFSKSASKLRHEDKKLG